MRKILMAAGMIGALVATYFTAQRTPREHGEFDHLLADQVNQEGLLQQGKSMVVQRVANTQVGVLNEKLESMSERLHAMELAQDKGAQGRKTSPDDAEDEKTPKQISERDLTDWMQEELRLGQSDPDWAHQAALQISAALDEQLPEVDLQEAECGPRFCRATFVQDDGETPDVLPLLGAPPFDAESSTMTEEDGRLSVYFTRRDDTTTFEGLRTEAKAAKNL